MEVGCSLSIFEKSSVKAGWLIVAIRWRVEVLALFVVDRPNPDSIAAFAWVVTLWIRLKLIFWELCKQNSPNTNVEMKIAQSNVNKFYFRNWNLILGLSAGWKLYLLIRFSQLGLSKKRQSSIFLEIQWLVYQIHDWFCASLNSGRNFWARIIALLHILW